jgi:hypothetical protein
MRPHGAPDRIIAPDHRDLIIGSEPPGRCDTSEASDERRSVC